MEAAPTIGFVRCSKAVQASSNGAGSAGRQIHSCTPSTPDPFRVPFNLNGKGFQMYNATEQFADINKVGYDNAVRIASLSLDKAERFTKLNLQAAKVALEQGVFTANAVAGIKDVQELAAVRAKLTEAGMQNALGYSRGVYQIASEAQVDFSELAEEAWASYTKGIAA